jgi:dephospho-CoA kinase
MSMRTVFLAGGIGSGKSTVARELERLGAARIDLDQLSRDVLCEDKGVIARVCEAFGEDLIDPATGVLNRGLLASRAFASRESAALLEAIELPAITRLLERRLAELATPQLAAGVEAEAAGTEVSEVGDVPQDDAIAHGLAGRVGAPQLAIVEVPLLDRVDEATLALADGVLVVWCPLELRRERAIGRGMTGEDFDARAANQPSDEWLRAHATELLDNSAGTEELLAATRDWYNRQLFL